MRPMAAAKKAAAPAPPPSNSQYPFYIHPKIIINLDFVEYDKSGRRGWKEGGRASGDSRI